MRLEPSLPKFDYLKQFVTLHLSFPSKQITQKKGKQNIQSTIDLRLWLLKVNPIDFIKCFCCSYMILAIDLQCVCLILCSRKTLSFVIILRVFVDVAAAAAADALLTNPKIYDKFGTKRNPFRGKSKYHHHYSCAPAYNSRLNGLNVLKVFPKCKWSGTRPA